MYERDILDLTPETFDETELGFRATVFLTLVVDFLGDFLLENLRELCVFEDLVLAEGQKFFETVLSDGKPDDELLPWKERTIEGAS